MNDDFNENKDIQDNIDMPLKDDNDNKSEEKQSKDEKSINHDVIHKKDGRLHIYVRQDKYKGELKSKIGLEEHIYLENKQFTHQERRF